jgi:hypothetical protein
MGPLDDIEEFINELIRKEGKVVIDSKEIGSAGKTIDLPLKDRLSKDNEGALDRVRLEKAKRSESYNEGSASDDEIQTSDDAVVDKYIDDIFNRLMNGI